MPMDLEQSRYCNTGGIDAVPNMFVVFSVGIILNSTRILDVSGIKGTLTQFDTCLSR